MEGTGSLKWNKGMWTELEYAKIKRAGFSSPQIQKWAEEARAQVIRDKIYDLVDLQELKKLLSFMEITGLGHAEVEHTPAAVGIFRPLKKLGNPLWDVL